MGAKLLFLEAERYMEMEITVVTVDGQRAGALCWEDFQGADAMNHAEEADPALAPWVLEPLALVFIHFPSLLDDC